MADYFDSLRGTTPALLSDEERKRLGLLTQVMEAIPARAGSDNPDEQAMLSQAGFIQQPGQTGYITPERLIAQQQAAVMDDQIAEIQKRYDDQRTSAMFRLGDGLADAGRLFLSPLLFLAGEDFNDYDPSAKLRAGYRRELQGLVQTQNESLTNLINARTEREETLRDIREDRAKLGPFGGMGESMNSWASRTLYSPARDPSSPQYAAAFQHMFGLQTGFDAESGRPYQYRREIDPNVPLPTGYQAQPVMQPEPQEPEQADAATTVVSPIAPAGTPMGGPSEKRTDASNKAEVYGGQMFEPAMIMMQMEQQGYRISPIALKAVETLGSAAMTAPGISEADKAYLAAMDSFINGRLRFESGAAISEEEYKRAVRQSAAVTGVDGGSLAIRQRQRFNTLEAVIRSTAPSYRDSPNTAAALKAIRDSLPPSYQYTPVGAEDDDDFVELPDDLPPVGAN